MPAATEPAPHDPPRGQADRPLDADARRIAFVGNPNVGKTTLFNKLAGLRAQTSNFPGTTQEARLALDRTGTLPPGSRFIDLPGTYSLTLDTGEARVTRGTLDGSTAPRGEQVEAPSAVCVVLDACDLPRGFLLLGEVLRTRLPMVVAINMVDSARRRGIRGDEEELARRLGCEVVVCSGRTGEGVEALRAALGRARIPIDGPRGSQEALEQWADELAIDIFAAPESDARQSLTDRFDRAFTHPLSGLTIFAAVMTLLFWSIFKLATYPMDWIDGAFGWLAGAVGGALGDGLISQLLADGIIAGVGATAVFLPQIVLLFLLIALIEDTGYLARAAFVMDRVMRPFGLNGHAFVPLLSSHACALPGIMACRGIPDRRDRLAAILVAPFMSCTARIPVYVLLVSLLFPGRPGVQALAFTGCYAIGAIAGLLSSLVIRRTILRGRSRPMLLELPEYRPPQFGKSIRLALERGMVFLKKAGTVILAISIVLWWLGSFPQGSDAPSPDAPTTQTAPAETLAQDAPTDSDDLAPAPATYLERLGSIAQPIFAPLGYDRQLTVGVLASFAAREVFVTTMAVTVLGDEDADIADEGVLRALSSADRADGSPLFDTPTTWSLLVYFILAMQCLPTLAVTAREAGGVRWAFVQLGWMSGLAWVLAAVTYQSLSLIGAS